MRKKYEKPNLCTMLLRGPILMLGGSNTVKGYNTGGDINVGDKDEPSSSNGNGTTDWGSLNSFFNSKLK